ncbi:ABC transporter substrate-binding protein [Alkalihalobacterium alkalinitrilicum]|uniref:ABC transporter substrate-binding protein n=1 Tax=Alkalihalobacterium alkalinitrilicum TaxID=427920 RepID=UPI000995AEDF|nr:ABC transporter substrate-binding protein [Alkalihalobacterium alkalinitrilicum]
MRVCSFLPAATSMIAELGLEEYLYGVTFECPSEKPRVVRSHLEGRKLSSSEINETVKQYMNDDKNLYYVDMELLQKIEPDIIFTQHVCNVCQIGTSYVEEVVKHLPKQPKIIPLIPHRLDEVYNNLLMIARELNEEEKGLKRLEVLKRRTSKISNKLQHQNLTLKKVMVMEWLEPIFNCGHWIPDQIELAGGYDPLGNPGGHSRPIEWNDVLASNPEVLVIAPCGFTPERAMKEIELLEKQEGWHDLYAVQNKQIYIVDGDLFTRPSTTLVDGIELLAALFHPQQFSMPVAVRDKVVSYYKS